MSGRWKASATSHYGEISGNVSFPFLIILDSTWYTHTDFLLQKTNLNLAEGNVENGFIASKIVSSFFLLLRMDGFWIVLIRRNTVSLVGPIHIWWLARSKYLGNSPLFSLSTSTESEEAVNFAVHTLVELNACIWAICNRELYRFYAKTMDYQVKCRIDPIHDPSLDCEQHLLL